VECGGLCRACWEKALLPSEVSKTFLCCHVETGRESLALERRRSQCRVLRRGRYEDNTVTSTLRDYNKGSVLSTWVDRRVLPILNTPPC
jgi:hypothetical protein